MPRRDALQVTDIPLPPSGAAAGAAGEALTMRQRRDVSGLLLSDADLMEILGIGQTKFTAMKKAGAFDFLMPRPRLTGDLARYSGTLVQKWRDGVGASDRRQQHPGTEAGKSDIALRLLGRAR